MFSAATERLNQKQLSGRGASPRPFFVSLGILLGKTNLIFFLPMPDRIAGISRDPVE
jgi:hypothetical protein